MSYAAVTPDCEANAKLTGQDPVLASMVADLRENGEIVVELAGGLGAEYVEAARALLMNELCEPVTAEMEPGRIIFRRAWAKGVTP